MRLIPHTATWRRSRYRLLSTVVAALALVAAFAGGAAGTRIGPASARDAAATATLLSQGKTATASSMENASFPASAAVDGNTGTRWSSAFSDPQWLEVDLGSSATISQVVLHWETAYATAFQIQTSPDGTNWTTDLLHHHRHRRHPDAERHRHRPLRPDVRHRPGHPVRATACGSSRSTARPAPGRPATPPTPPSTTRPPPPRWRTPPTRPRPPSTATPAPGGPARSATRSGCRSTSAPARRSAR